MSSDIKKRLRGYDWMFSFGDGPHCLSTAPQEAADRIEALEGELLKFQNLAANYEHEKKLAEAEAARLRKFRDIVEEFSDHDDPSVKYAMREALEGK